MVGGLGSKSAELAEGVVIANTYKLTSLLGKGGMGTVWAADHARLPGKKVAIKVLHTELGENAELLARFKREAEIASRLGHPNIVEVHDLGELPDGAPYIVLEYLIGKSLRDEMDNGPMPLEWTKARFREMCSGLSAAHAIDIVHRDLKPENVFLVNLGGEQTGQTSAKILDFGISKIRGSTTLKTQERTMLGTPQYMAPEQALGKHSEIDGRADIFALGAMAYEMLAGSPAFTGQTIPEVVFQVVYEEATPLTEKIGDCPQDVADAIHKAMAKKPEDRFQTVDDFVMALTGRRLGDTQTPGTPRAIDTPPPMGNQNNVSSKESVAKTMASQATPPSAVSGFDKTVVGEALPSLSQDTPVAARPTSKKWLIALPIVLAGLLAVGFFLKPSSMVDKKPKVVASTTDLDAENTAPAEQPSIGTVVDPVRKNKPTDEKNRGVKKAEKKPTKAKTKGRTKVQKGANASVVSVKSKQPLSSDELQQFKKGMAAARVGFAKKSEALKASNVLRRTPHAESHGILIRSMFRCSTQDPSYHDGIKKLSGTHRTTLKNHCNKVFSDRAGKL